MHTMLSVRWLVFGGVVCLVQGLSAVSRVRADEEDAAPDRPLNLQRIFSSDEFESVNRRLRWTASGQSYQSLEAAPHHKQAYDLVAYDAKSHQRQVVVAAQDLIPAGRKKPLVIRDFAWSADGRRLLIFTNTRRVWRTHTRGDYWVYDPPQRTLRQLGADKKPARLMFAKFGPRGNRAAYVYENDLYVEHIDSGHIRRLTHRDSEDVINGTSDWVYEEEFRLRDGFRWSADGCHIAYWQFDTSGMREFTLINNTADIYPRLTKFKYPKVGETNPACRVGVVSTDGGKTRWMQIPGAPREHYLPRMDWIGDRSQLLVQQFNRLQNTVRLFVVDAESAAARCVHTETDAAWIDLQASIDWIENDREFVWLSERSGWRQIERVAAADGRSRPITTTAYDVISIVHVDAEGGWLYYLASPQHPAQRYLFRARLDGSRSERITPGNQPGTHSYQIAPGAEWALHRYSRFGRAPVTDLVRLPDHVSRSVVLPNTRLKTALKAIERPRVEFFQTEISAGVKLDGWLMIPRKTVPGKKYPLLVYVYGEPAGQTVLDRWQGTRYLWHTLLTQQGYFVMSIDNRGTPAPKGRAWRKSVYRQIGILAAADQAAALKQVLSERPELDAARVGIWGWSGGGSMTLNALFRYPDLYQLGIAIAPVSNQLLYDTIYQERYMGLPKDNVAGYRDGSPIQHAQQLKGDLLLIHGTGDDNVHYQSVESLVNRLISANKQFSMMAYPNRTHSIREGQNTTRHLYETMYRFLSNHLPAGPR